jgi:uncharacterized YccA/Bax inhibitor family protein
MPQPLAKAFISQPRALDGECMTLEGTVNKSFLLLVVLLLGALSPWVEVAAGGPRLVALAGISIMAGFVGGLILSLVIAFVPRLAPYLAIPYAALEGMAIGGLSAGMEGAFPGIALQAVVLTFAVLGTMLVAYRLRLIHVTAQFRAIVIAGTGAIALLALLYWGLRLTFHVSLPFMGSGYDSTEGGLVISILVSLGVLVFAAFNLLLDFDLIESGVAGGAPRYMEWFGAFSLILTLVWLYLEILRLLARLRMLLRLLQS